MGDRHAALQFYNSAVQVANDKSQKDWANHAYQLFSSACLVDPTWWEAFYQAGNNCSDLEYMPKEASIACYRRALECEMEDDKRAKCLINIGWKSHQLGRTREALAYSEQALKYNVKEPYGWVNLSCIYQTLLDSKASLRCAQRALALAPDDPMVQTCHAFGLLFDRRLESGLKAFEARFAYELTNFTQFPYPKWHGERGKTIYLISDQGIGDTLCYARFLRETCKRCKYVHAYVHDSLMRAFSHAFVDIPNLNLTPTSTPFQPADYWTTFVSLPYALGLSDEEIRNAPPIEIPVYSSPYNWKVPDRKIHIGICWAGSPLNKIDVWRNVPVEQFAELYRVSGVQLYSLQVGEKHKEMHDRGFSSIIRDLVPYIRDVVDTVSLLQHLDLVIGVESAMGHICSTVGKEYWMPYSRWGKDYRVGVDGTDRIWTPRHRVFLQSVDEPTWGLVFERITDALRERVHGKEQPKLALMESA
jgi:hypothetical protein